MTIQDYTTIASELGITHNERLNHALLQALQVSPRMRIIDLGCGAGGQAMLLASTSGASVFGLDRSLIMPQLSRSLYPIVNADAFKTPFSASIFDGAYAVNLLQLLGNRQAFFSECFRILKPACCLALPWTNRKQIRARFLNRFFPGLLAVEKTRYPTFQMICQELRFAGLEIKRPIALDLGWFTPDQAYLRRQRTGIFSGLLLLDKEEREQGFRSLERAISKWEKTRSCPKIRWVRTLIVARKPQQPLY